jgi:hypothetical protein
MKRKNQQHFKWAVWLTFIFIGFRACVVGADTYYYTMGYMGLDYYKGEDLEPLYNDIYIAGLSYILKYEPFFILVNTICSLTPLYLLVKKYSRNKVLSILWFFIFDIYIIYFVALRQILGLALLLVGVLYVIENKPRKWLVYILCAGAGYGFHNSIIIPSILYVILYFLRLNSRKFALIIITVTSIFGIVLQSFNIMDFFNIILNINANITTERLNNYMMDEHIKDLNSTSGYLYLLRYAWLGFFVFFFMDKDKLNHWFSKIFLVSICLYNLFYSVDMISRMNIAFYVFSIVVFTWSFGKRYKQIIKSNKLIKLIPILILFWFVQSFVRSHIGYKLDNYDRMHPYYFFWEDYRTHPSLKN